MKLKNKIIIFVIFTLFFLGRPTLASTTSGTIDPTYRYAWGENVGFIDFKNITITDTSLSGSAYCENIGFINLNEVTNDNEGHLSGYAWGENIGFIDFSEVDIDSNGIFSGQAYGENIGFITFGTENNKVATDWRPESSRLHSTSGSMARYIPTQIITTIPPNPTTPTPTTLNITRTLKFQMRGTDIKNLQTYLNSHNYNCGIADGIFGPKTKQAIIKFQLANQLQGDGIVGPLTRSKLK